MADQAIIIQEDNLPKIWGMFESVANQAVRETIFDIARRSVILMQGTKTGREYPRPNGMMHQASAPGEAPAVDTGNLFNSIRAEMTGPQSGVVYTHVEYAPILEYGSAKMAARPFFAPATEAAWPEFMRRLGRIGGG